MKYTKYQFLTDNLLSQLFKAGNVPKGKRNKKNSIVELGSFLDANSGVLFENDGLFLLHEYRWRESDKTVIFPASDTVLDSIQAGHYDLDMIEAIPPFSNDFLLHFPHNYRIAGKKASSCLISFYNGSDTPNLFKNFYLNHNMKCKHIPSYIEQNTMVQILYRMHDEDNQASSYSLNIPWKSENLSDFIRYQSIDEYKSHHEFSILNLKLSAQEESYQFELLRLVISMMIYVHVTNQETLKPGFPGQVISKDKSKFLHFGMTSPITLKTRSNHTIGNLNKEAHYRSWHIRQYMDEKYYKNEWANQPIGSRLGFVKETIVGDVTAKTLVNNKD